MSIKNIIKCLRVNQKTRPYIKTKINGNYTYHSKTKLVRGKNSYRKKIIKFGPDKYKISLYYDNYAISISHKRIKIANNDEVIFSGYTIDGDEYFNLVLAYTDLPSPQEIKYIREYTSKYCVPSDYIIYQTKVHTFCIAHLFV